MNVPKANREPENSAQAHKSDGFLRAAKAMATMAVTVIRAAIETRGGFIPRPRW